jgi:hypothetical protein
MNQPQSSPAPVAPPHPPKRNGLGITAVVFAALFFIPLAPLIGLILGIVTLATRRNKTLGIVAVCLGGFFTLFLGVEVAIAIPAFMRYVRRSKTVEATMNLRRIGDGVLALDATQWPKLSDSDWTPAQSPCTQPAGKFAPNASLWQVDPWKAIGFSVDDPAYYQYRLRRNGQGFVIEAQGDLDCDGVLSHFSRQVAPDGLGALQSENEIE